MLRVFPVLGVPLPFMSQGGTSLLSVLVASGVLLAFARSLPGEAAAARVRASRARPHDAAGVGAASVRADRLIASAARRLADAAGRVGE